MAIFKGLPDIFTKQLVLPKSRSRHPCIVSAVVSVSCILLLAGMFRSCVSSPSSHGTDLDQTGQAYSAVEKHSAWAVVLSTVGFAPHSRFYIDSFFLQGSCRTVCFVVTILIFGQVGRLSVTV